jgi:hypothetical protein
VPTELPTGTVTFLFTDVEGSRRGPAVRPAAELAELVLGFVSVPLSATPFDARSRALRGGDRDDARLGL